MSILIATIIVMPTSDRNSFDRHCGTFLVIDRNCENTPGERSLDPDPTPTQGGLLESLQQPFSTSTKSPAVNLCARLDWEKVQVLLICRGVGVVTRGLGPLGR